MILAAAFGCACIAAFLRRPDALLNPQFFAEDGTIWYVGAYDLGGFRALFVPSHRGYFHTAERLGAWLSVAVPFALAPLVMNLIAVLVHALPAVLVVSKRFESLVPKLWARAVLALIVIGVPGTWGTLLNLTHSQWQLAMLACIVVAAPPARSAAWKAHDVAAVLLSGLTGPTCIVLAPLGLALWWRRRERWTLTVALITVGCALLQFASIAVRSAPPVESTRPLGVGIFEFLRVFAQRIVDGALFGQRISSSLIDSRPDVWGAAWIYVPLAIFGLAVLAYAIWKGTDELRLVIGFGLLTLAGALFAPVPMNLAESSYWEMFATPGRHARYFYPLTLAFILALVWIAARAPARALRWIGIGALAPVFLCAIPLDWMEPAYRDFRFAEYAEKFERSLPGDRLQIPIPPGWSFFLTKR